MGDREAGKSEFLRRITGQTYRDDCSQTVGADFTISEYEFVDREVHLFIWDLNGHPSFSLLRQYYLHGADLYVIVIDASNPDSIGRAAEWKAEVDKAKVKGTGIIVATKIDLAPDRAAAEKAVGEVASQLGLDALLVSAKTGEGCGAALREIIKRVEPAADVSAVKIRDLPPGYTNDPLVASRSSCS